jgi:hypothetical protein
VRAVGRRRAATAGLLQATTLTFVIVATEIGLETGKLTPATAAALVAAGLLSAALFPAPAARLLARPGPGARAHIPRPRPAGRDQEAEPTRPPPATDSG